MIDLRPGVAASDSIQLESERANVGLEVRHRDVSEVTCPQSFDELRDLIAEPYDVPQK